MVRRGRIRGRGGKHRKCGTGFGMHEVSHTTATSVHAIGVSPTVPIPQRARRVTFRIRGPGAEFPSIKRSRAPAG